MLLVTGFIFASLLYSLSTPLQINLHLTDSSCPTDTHTALQHHCLHVLAHLQNTDNRPHEIITFCLSECPQQWTFHNIQHQHLSFTFAELTQQHITPHQLYLWSASIELVERYQLFLDPSPAQRSPSLASEVFFNCTWPRFGPQCQYSFDHLTDDHSSSESQSLSELIHDFYVDHQYEPTTMTCYMHVKCDRGPAPSCLDWSEICDGKVDCLDGGRDEEECWRVELHECGENEYRCMSGQCIPQSFFRDDSYTPDCWDGSDEIRKKKDDLVNCQTNEPAIACEDLTCTLHRPSFTMFLITSSCEKQRNILLWRAKISVKPAPVSDDCWFAFICSILLLYMSDAKCRQFCAERSCTQITQQTCPDSILVPTTPVLEGHVQFIYQIDQSPSSRFRIYRPLHVCYNEHYCNDLPDNRTLLKFSNTTCRRPQDFPMSFDNMGHISILPAYLPIVQAELSTCHSLSGMHSILCNKPNTYRCLNSSKCISVHRLHDGRKDCYHNDDEQLPIFNPALASEQLTKHFRCANADQLISQHLVGDKECHCERDESGVCDDEYPEIQYARGHISFQTICDGTIELNPRIIDNQMMTDETDCDQWICNNTYTRCDGFWNCFNGADEVDCDPSPIISCPRHHHLCWSLQMNRTICLPMSRADDGIVDCVGATDEPRLCRRHDQHGHADHFYCENDTWDVPCMELFQLCDGRRDCRNGEDEIFCRERNDSLPNSVCYILSMADRSQEENTFCERFSFHNKQHIVYFSLDQLSQTTQQQQQQQLLDDPLITTDHEPRPYSAPCHRGLTLRVWSDQHNNLSPTNTTTTTCLCPSSLYGPRCQYQNQRVTLTLQFRALSDSWQTLFAILVLLVDHTHPHQSIIESSQQLSYLPMRDCQTKFNLYLLYATRPKHSNNNNYSVEIHIFEKITLDHRSTWSIPLRFSFLPVHRLALQLDIPRVVDTGDQYPHRQKDCPSHSCVHGQCVKYASHSSNSGGGQRESSVYCQCDRGWSGRSCSVSIDCRCSLDSLCMGVDATNRSICVCPMTKLGDRCLIRNEICDQDPCAHGGQCVPIDEYLLGGGGGGGGGGRSRDVTCICRRGYTGDRCERKEVEMLISFHSHLILPQSLLAHFIRYHSHHPHQNATTFKAIPINQDSITLFWPQPFHLVILELVRHDYYLAFLRPSTPPLNSSTSTSTDDVLTKTMNTSDRCPHIDELFNETILRYHLLRRIKYYHLLCQHRTGSEDLKCFVDEIHLCVCQDFGEERLANCFEFDHEKKLDCLGQNGCENGAQCFQDNPTCPQTSMCICPTCFYGRRCQFSMNGFGLSLDAILAYHIRPHVPIKDQSHLIQISVIATSIITCVGLINGFLALITFKNKKPREVGCGYYLLGSSITTLLTMIMFTLKFWLLISIQIGYITNRSLMFFQCLSLDFLLRICLNMDQWLNACVAMERAVTALKGIDFNGTKSREAVKYTLAVLVIAIISTTVHDPIYRRLIDEKSNSEEGERTWCIVSYPSRLRGFDSVVNMTHFLGPFIINLISGVIIIWRNARHRRHVQNRRRFLDLLLEQVRFHSHLLMAPFLIVLLAFPRLLIGIFANCMQSTKQSWLYLSGYFIAFTVPMLTFVLYVLPSRVYKNEFYKTVRHRRIRWDARIHPASWSSTFASLFCSCCNFVVENRLSVSMLFTSFLVHQLKWISFTGEKYFDDGIPC